MEILTNVGMALVLISVITVIVSAMMTKYSEKSYLRLKRRQQRDRADRHITMFLSKQTTLRKLLREYNREREKKLLSLSK